MKKTSVILFLLLVTISLAVVTQVSAYVVSYGNIVWGGDAGKAGADVWEGVRFNITSSTVSSWRLLSIRVNFYNDSLDCNAKAIVYGSDMVTIVANSTAMSAPITSNTWQDFEVDCEIENATNYYFGIVRSGSIRWGVSSSGNQLTVGYKDTSNSYSTPTSIEDATYEGFTWMIQLFFDTELAPTDAPSLPLPTGGSYDTSDTDAVISTLTGYLVPLLTFLLPALILGWVTHWEKWPIMIGLAIGSGLTYLFLGSAYVWLVFLVAVGLAGMVFSGRMRHDE